MVKGGVRHYCSGFSGSGVRHEVGTGEVGAALWRSCDRAMQWRTSAGRHGCAVRAWEHDD